ncbi:MAG: SRPBCC family protein [Bacteroidota bacterium]
MEIIQKIIVEKSVSACWAVLGDQFTEIYTWASQVNHASGDGEAGINGAACDIRSCDVSGIGKIEEELIAFDPARYHLAYNVTKGLPDMMKAAQNSWTLIPISENRTRVEMKANFQLQGFLSALMKPVIKVNFKKMTKHLVEDFKFYLETGEVHPRKIKARKKYALKSAPGKVLHNSMSLIGLLLIVSLLNSCKLADLRTSEIKEGSPVREDRAVQLLDEVIANSHLQKLANAEAYSFQATDDWKGMMTLMNPLPKDNEPMEFRYRPNTFDGQFHYTEAKNKTIHGVQSFNYYKLEDEGTMSFEKNKKITFTIPAIQYFFELPLRLRNAPILKYAGQKEFEGETYDLVFATWQQLEAHKEHDQYLLYISQGTRELKFANYTIRANYVPAPKSMYGSVRYEKRKSSQDGIVYPSEIYIQVNELKKEEKSAHVLTIQELKLNGFNQEDLYPSESIEFIGDAKK